jgi:hypothetical protein
MFTLHAPEKKRGYYVSSITKKTGKKIRITCDDVRIINMGELANESGFLLQTWLGNADDIIEIERDVLDQVCAKNQEWFQNDLSKEKITEYFRSCLDANNTCTCTVSSVKPPVSITLNNTDVTDFSDIFSQGTRVVRDMQCTCVIEIAGMYYYPKKFGLKLTIHKIKFTDPSFHTQDTSDDDTGIVDKDELEQDWADELVDVSQQIQTDIHVYEQRIQHLRTFQEDLVRLLKETSELRVDTNRWSEKLEQLRALVFQYKTGRLL